MAYYKVVRVTPDGCYHSAIVHNEIFAKEYKVGEWTVSTIGGLLVFFSKEAAIGFRNYYVRSTPTKIFEVEASGVVTLPKYGCGGFHWPAVSIDYIERLWSGGSLAEWDAPLAWPSGTLAFKKVKLIKEVTHNGTTKTL